MTTSGDKPDKPREASEGAVGKTRGKGFPVMPLGDVVKILKEASKYGSEHRVTAFAGYMGHQSVKSGPFLSRFAAFKDFKLVAVKGDLVTLTELGKRIAFPPDPDREQEDLRRAFIACEIFATTYESSAKGVTLQTSTIANNAVLNLGIAARTKEVFAKSFVESATTAGLAEKVADGKVRLLAEPAATSPGQENGEHQRAGGDGRGAHAGGDNVGTSFRAGGGAAAPLAVNQTWEIPTGQIIFQVRVGQALPAEAFPRVGEIVKAIKELADSLAAAGHKDVPTV